ncbi:MAG: glycoside hydrolase family 5 protein, partial [Cyanobacteria bacterium J06635_10]
MSARAMWRLLCNIPQKNIKPRNGLVLGCLCIILSFSFFYKSTTSIAATNIVSPLSARNSQIIDARGQVVLLNGINWFGMEIDTHVPHGLWVRDYKQMLSHIKSLGYNLIRLPYSVEALNSSEISSVDFSIGANAELYGKTPIQVMDLI